VHKANFIKIAAALLVTALLLPILNFHTFVVQPQSPAARPADKYADKLRLFEEVVRQQMQKDKIPGMTIGFFKDDYTWVKGFGYADLENKLPARPESSYRLAPLSQAFTGAAILQLVEQGKMSLDGEIQSYVPYYPKQKWPVTVRQLLVHLGGGQIGSGLGPDYVPPREVVARIAKNPIQNEPGVKFDYQLSGYNLLGAAVEEVTGKPFGEYLRESIWKPLGMNNTHMDSVRELVPNRVRGYEVVNGEIKNARFFDVSTRFGGGGAIGTVPDLLTWAREVDSGKILSKASTDLMYTPVANKAGRYVGIRDAEWYYALGWMVFPINGQAAIWSDGAQIGSNTALLRVPSQNLAIAFACNLQDVDRISYIKRLYEIITDEPMANFVFTRNKVDQTFYKGLSDTFDYGSLYLERNRRPLSANAKEVAKAFAYFNSMVDRRTLQSNYQATLKAVNDGRHPVADLAFIKVGSYMAMKLGEKHGAARAGVYHTIGAPAFFDDYIKLYKSNRKHPRELRFKKPFEEIIARWNRDWTRTWNEETRQLSITPASNFDEIGERLKTSFAGAEVYPDFLEQLLGIKPPSLKAVKLGVDLYPESARANLVWGLFLLLINQTEEGRAAVQKTVVEKEPPLTYFKRSIEIDPEGVGSAGSLNQVARSWIGERDRMGDAETLLKLAIELHPQSGSLHEALGELYLKKGLKDQAIGSYQRALQLDPNLQQAKEALKKLSP
jgi:CubicO group peptidase (beta-lactamase class C family)